MLHYILQVVTFQLLFLIIYDVCLKKETFFNLNRVYLLLTAVLSIVIPFIKIDRIKTVIAKDFVINLPEVIIGNASERVSAIDPQIAMQAGINIQPEPMSVLNILLVSGMCITTTLFLIKFINLFWLMSKNPKRWKGNLVIVSLRNSTKAFSFFHYVFLGALLNAEEKQTILDHETVHVQHKHSWDLLFFELMKILFWFNPLIYMYQIRIAAQHEFIADAKAVKRHNRSQYYDNLLTQVFETQQFSFVNPFFKQSLIKKRILMLNRSKSKQISMLKYLLLIPSLFVMLVYTSSYAQEQETHLTETIEISELQELPSKELKERLYRELVEMEENGKSFFEIANFVMKDEDVYIKTREQYFRFEVFVKYISDRTLKTKSEDGTLTDKDLELYQNVSNEPKRTYKEYLDWKKTDEAKVIWENQAKGGMLRLVVNKGGSGMTDDEKKRFQEKLDLLDHDDSYKGLLVVPIEGGAIIRINGIKTDEIIEVSEIDKSIDVPFSVIDEVPTYTFCDSLKTNEERKTCMVEGITKHVTKKFNTKMAMELGLTGRVRINVIFKIDENGFVKDVRARAPHPDLETEAKRVIGELPQFIPGKQKGKTVNVPYSLPIIFQVNSDAKTFDTSNPTDSTNYETFGKVLKTTSKNQSEGIPFSTVDEVPMYDSCAQHSTQEGKKRCVGQEISRFVNKEFNLDLASKLNLVGKQRINVLFKIDKNGVVFGARARAPHPELETEAIRVVNSLPRFTPGKMNGKPVIVNYSLPILFEVTPFSSNDNKN